MKKLFFFIMALLSATAVMAQQTVNVNADGYYEVWDAQQLKQVIQDDNSAKIQLMANIDAAKIGKLCGTFTGVITGKHKQFIEELNQETDAMYAIIGSRLNETVGSDKTDSWLFDKVDGASFSYIYFANFRVEEDGGSNLGLIAREAVNSSFASLTFDNVSIYEPDDYAGVIVGTAQTCRFEYITTKFTDVTVDGKGSGTMAGKSANGFFYMCIVSVTSAVYADGKWAGDALAGGIVGSSDHDNFLGCLNSGLVGGKAHKIGGIAGASAYSQFTSCNNDYAVLFCDETGSKKDKLYFRDLVNNTRQKVNELTIEKKKEFENQITGISAGALGGGAASLITALVIYNSMDIFTAVTQFSCCSLFEFCWMMINQSHTAYYAAVAAKAAPAIGFFTFTIGLFVAFAVAVVVDAIIIITDYDDVGGICGCAEYCDFEQCTNHAQLVCDDGFAGGIVGFADGGTINNCLNTGKIYNDGADTRGGILGAPRNNPLVTNCLSTQDYPIIGKDEYRGLDDIDINSGNNYRYENPDMSNGYRSLEMQVRYDKIGTGVVANWLNNGAQNRQKGIRPWRQNLKGVDFDSNPVLDINHDEVLPTDISHITISNEEQLRAFANEVNGGYPFTNAVLENDIVINSGAEWTPIGTKDNRYRGIFDGQGHTISGLECTVEQNSEEGAGLFGTVDVHADIRNVILDSSCEISNRSEYGAGGIVGTVRNDGRGWGNVLVTGCGNYGKVTGAKHAGGILGRVINDGNDGDGSYVQVALDKCFNTGEIKGDGSSALLCGYMQNYGHLTNCWTAGSLKQSGNNRVYNTENPTGEAEYFTGYNQKLDISYCFDYIADVEWDGLEQAKQNQKGVTKTTEIEVMPDNHLVHHYAASKPEGADLVYGTVCLPYPLTSGTALKYYTFNEAVEDNGEVVFKFAYVENLPAGTPALFSCTVGGNIDFSNDGTDFTGTPMAWQGSEVGWKFLGTFAPQTFEGDEAQGIYYLANNIICNDATANIPSYTAYFSGPQNANVSFLIEDESGDVTAIELVKEDIVPSGRLVNNKTYSILGIEVGDDYHGIVIKNGKKILQK